MGDGQNFRSNRSEFSRAFEQILAAAKVRGASGIQITGWLAEGIASWAGLESTDPRSPVSQEEFLESKFEDRLACERASRGATEDDLVSDRSHETDPAALNLGQQVDQVSELRTLTPLQQVQFDADRALDRTAKHSDRLDSLRVGLKGVERVADGNHERLERHGEWLKSLERERNRGVYAQTVNGKMAQDIGEQKALSNAVNSSIESILIRCDKLEDQRIADRDNRQHAFQDLWPKINELLRRVSAIEGSAPSIPSIWNTASQTAKNFAEFKNETLARLSSIEKNQQDDCNHLDELRQVCGRRFAQIDELTKPSDILREKLQNLREALTKETQDRIRSAANLHDRISFPGLGAPEDDGPT